MAVMRSRLRAHAVEWHVAPAAHIDSRHRAGFLDLQRRCNQELFRHAALTRNAWLDRLEATLVPPLPARLLSGLQQLAQFLRQLALAREAHARQMQAEAVAAGEDCGTAVVICFDENGVPWCPPLPGTGMGDPGVMSDRLQAWWTAWRHAAGEPPETPPWDATESLCELVRRDYNSTSPSVSLGIMMALENAISTDFWQRLGRSLKQWSEQVGIRLPDPGFLPVAETHARLQARHVLYLVEGASVHDLLDEDLFFAAGLEALGRLDRFWDALAEATTDSLRH